MRKDAQYDPWSWVIIGLVLVAVCVALLVTPSRAEDEQVLAESVVGQGGLICDTAAEVETFIAGIETGEEAQAMLIAINGCGILQRPLRMRVVGVKTLKTEKAEYLLVRYDFLDVPIPPQFGIGHRKLAGIGI